MAKPCYQQVADTDAIGRRFHTTVQSSKKSYCRARRLQSRMLRICCSMLKFGSACTTKTILNLAKRPNIFYVYMCINGILNINRHPDKTKSDTWAINISSSLTSTEILFCTSLRSSKLQITWLCTTSFGVRLRRLWPFTAKPCCTRANSESCSLTRPGTTVLRVSPAWLELGWYPLARRKNLRLELLYSICHNTTGINSTSYLLSPNYYPKEKITNIKYGNYSDQDGIGQKFFSWNPLRIGIPCLVKLCHKCWNVFLMYIHPLR